MVMVMPKTKNPIYNDAHADGLSSGPYILLWPRRMRVSSISLAVKKMMNSLLDEGFFYWTLARIAPNVQWLITVSSELRRVAVIF